MAESKASILIAIAAALVASAFVASLAPCAHAQAEVQEDDAPKPPCKYLSFFASTESNFKQNSLFPPPERSRKTALKVATEALVAQGLRNVRNPADASWVLQTGEWLASNGSPLLRITLTPSGRISHDLFAVLMDDPEFPYRGALGAGRTLETLSSERDVSISARVSDASRGIWKIEAEQTLALCDADEKLLDEGWTTVEELRQKMVDEMTNVRRRREEARQKKKLKVEVDDSAIY